MTPTADGFLFSGPTYDSSDIVFSENTCLHMACWRAAELDKRPVVFSYLKRNRIKFLHVDDARMYERVIFHT
jgi:hypothetical protein